MRSFVSIPAGVFAAPLGRYTVLTLLGSRDLGASPSPGSAGRSAELGGASTTRSATSTTRSSRWSSQGSRISLELAGGGGERSGLRIARRAAIPLVDVKAQYAPLIPELKEAFAASSRAGASSSARRSRRSSARRPSTSACRRRSASRTAPTRSCSSLDALEIGAGRRGDLPGVHVLRHGRGDRAPRRDAGLRRHRPGDAEPRPGRGRARITPRTKAIMPVHLFGRPAPLDELRRARRCRSIEDAAQAFGSPGIATTASPRPSASSPRRTCSRSATAASSRCNDDELAERIRMLRFHGSRAKKTSSTSATTRASTRSRRRRCGSSCRTSTSGRARAARRPRATPSSASASSSSCRPTSRATSTTCTSCRSPERDRLARRARRGRDRPRVVLHDAAPPAAGAALPRLRPRARCPRPSGGAREPLPAALGRASRAEQQERSSRPSLGAAASRVVDA